MGWRRRRYFSRNRLVVKRNKKIKKEGEKMAVKFNDSKARYFSELLKGKTIQELLADVKETEEWDAEHYGLDPNDIPRRVNDARIEIEQVLEVFNKVKFLKKPLTFAVNAWGYEQTNYENFSVIGSYRASMIAVSDNGRLIYSIATKKFKDKVPGTYLDNYGIRSTDWKPGYTSEDIAEERMYNAYYGH